MKLLILMALLAFIWIPLSLRAQKAIDLRGVYSPSKDRSPEGDARIYMLNDHIYVLPYFGGVQVGRWNIDEDSLVTFTPKIPSHAFAFWSRQNKDLGDSMRIYFQGFEEDDNFISFHPKYSNPLLQRVFNESPNCVPYPAVYKFKTVADTIVVASTSYRSREGAPNDIYTFINRERHNDFIAFHFRIKSDDHPFYAKVRNGRLYFNVGDYSEKYPLPESGENHAFVTQFAQTIDAGLPDTMLYNPYYKNCEENVYDASLYRYDEHKGAFISLYNYEEGEEYTRKEDAYNRCFILYPFKQLKQCTKNKGTFTIAGKPLFVATCEERN